jgi:transcription elongation factor S-II
MDQREVETMINALQKALNEKEPVANVIVIMEKLKKDVAPTEDLLRVCSLTVYTRAFLMTASNITTCCGDNG